VNLSEYQRLFMTLSFQEDVPDAAFDELGERARFQLYRHMIRTRLLGMAKVAFRGTLETVGDEAFEASHRRYLAARPPRTPLIRDVIADFGRFAREDRALLSTAPTFLPDLLSFEELKWRVAYREVAYARVGGAGVRELDFEGAPVLNPTLELLSLTFAVHELASGRCEAGPLVLLVYRPPDKDDVRWYAADALLAEVLTMAREQPREGLGALVRAAAARCGVALDQALLEQLATSVTTALERGVLLGSVG
jgi:hypothetical protein